MNNIVETREEGNRSSLSALLEVYEKYFIELEEHLCFINIELNIKETRKGIILHNVDQIVRLDIALINYSQNFKR